MPLNNRKRLQCVQHTACTKEITGFHFDLSSGWVTMGKYSTLWKKKQIDVVTSLTTCELYMFSESYEFLVSRETVVLRRWERSSL